MGEILSSSQLDLLKEIGTVGSANAATALADLTAVKVDISVPQISCVPLENISSLLDKVERSFFVLDMEVKGDILGRIFLLLAPEDARYLSSHLLHKSAQDIDFNDELFRSAIIESANILCGSYLSALADMTKLKTISSVPSLAMDMVGAILDFIFIQIAQHSEAAIFIKTDLKVKGLNLEGMFLFFPFDESLKKIFAALGF